MGDPYSSAGGGRGGDASLDGMAEQLRALEPKPRDATFRQRIETARVALISEIRHWKQMKDTEPELRLAAREYRECFPRTRGGWTAAFALITSAMGLRSRTARRKLFESPSKETIAATPERVQLRNRTSRARPVSDQSAQTERFKTHAKRLNQRLAATNRFDSADEFSEHIVTAIQARAATAERPSRDILIQLVRQLLTAAGLKGSDIDRDDVRSS